MLKKSEVRNPNQINRIRSSLYCEWKWRVISEGAILVVVDWMQNWMRFHCFYCMDPGDCYRLPRFYFVPATQCLNGLIECDNSDCNWRADRFLIRPFSLGRNVFSLYWIWWRLVAYTLWLRGFCITFSQWSDSSCGTY